MVLVSIDPDGMARLISSLEVAADRLHHTVSNLRNRMDWAGCDTFYLSQISQIASWTDDELPGLRRRLDLALVADAQRAQSLRGTPVQFPEPTMTMAEAVALGEDLAGRLQSLGDVVVSAAEFEALSQELAACAGDPDVMRALVDELGAEGLLDVMTTVATFGSVEVVGVDERTALLDVMKSGLASVTVVWSEQECSDFAGALVDVAATQPTLDDGDSYGWPAGAFSYLLVDSHYSNGFLGGAMEEVDVRERASRSSSLPLWSEPATGGPSPWAALLPDDARDAANDPTVALMSALGQNPQVALDFFNPVGAGAQAGRSLAEERAQYYITDRVWADGDNALGEALDAAATGSHTAEAPVELQERSAWVASATVAYLAARDDNGGGRIGDAANDSVAHLLSAYITDVDAVAYGADGEGVVGSHVTPPAASWQVGLPVGAVFSVSTLNTVLGEVLLDDAAMEEIAQAAGRLNATRIDSVVTEWNANPDGATTVSGAVQKSSQLVGYLMGNLERGAVAEGAAIDAEVLARSELFVAAASAVVGLIPEVGSVAQFVVEESIDPPKVTSEAQAQAQMNELQDQAREDLKFAAALAMADSPYLQQESMREALTDENGTTYPWFTPDGVDPTVLGDNTIRNTFRDWIALDAGKIAELLPDSSTAFDDGGKRSEL